MKNLNQATPKSLIEAIENALGGLTGKFETEIYAVGVEIAVRDYLAQKFTPDLMSDPKVQDLWARITAGGAE